ncbi:RE1-silencing transcription factor-like isoform X1 [Ostrinia furnacalis]|uniref:RE1-silencing transcription factor-like isoform X1 n=1 Tax=Ostrinia furnacalis TaxID=93504 RepID=UPI001040D5AA|nr:RE1-silencing transcription factor-like isoform X1 [Ostrinia furnacalis]
MEKRKDSLSVMKICRFCLSQDDTLSYIYDRNKKPKNGISLSLKILSCLSMEVFPSDRMPAYLCKPCHFFLELFYKFKEICRSADESLMMHIQNGTPLEQMTWPSLLTKVYRNSTKSEPVVKTVVGDGTTVHVTSQDGSDSEDEDEGNVYNVKIGDESGKGSKRIRVVTSRNPDKERSKPTKSRQEDLSYEADTDEEPVPVKEVDEGCWPCDECHCTYPLEQLLNLHKKMKHRARTVHCDECNQKFFSKNDLVNHQVRHTDEMPFQCVACDRKFKRLILLKRHEKVMHSDIPQLPCSKCSSTFLSVEELEAHLIKHSRHIELNFPCKVCGKRYSDKTRLQKHKDTVHAKDPQFSCEYCPAQFNAITKLTRHVRTHAGDRSYPCKYCDKTFIKSHHYTRHLRLKHSTTMGTDALSDLMLRCDQCNEPFVTQDELIYHSAIHATQDLTCPLCQEKFQDVDSVTTHIKSHVTGVEFMCELCELIFTSKEKLDKHMTTAHVEELDHDDESMEAEAEDDDEDDTGINVTEEDGEMVVEIKKTGNFMLPDTQTNPDGIKEDTVYEENEVETTYTELANVEPLPVKEETLEPVKVDPEVSIAMDIDPNQNTKVIPKPVEVADSRTAPILRKAEEVKRKVLQSASPLPEKKIAKAESTSAGASEKSLRLLEKELQELKRTNTRNDAAKTPAKPMEGLRNRRPQLHTSTPKVTSKAAELKKEATVIKTSVVEKKQAEKKAVTKENKEPKEAKETKTAAAAKEDKKEEVKEKETPKSVKNGTTEKTQPEENVRRSTRPSKIKDYAKMIRDKSQDSDKDSEDDTDDEEYTEEEDKYEMKLKTRRSSLKTAPAKAAPAPAKAAPATPAPATPAGPRKRGRPRKEQPKEMPAAKVRKDDTTEDEDKEPEKNEAEPTNKIKEESSKQAEEPTSKPATPPAEKETADNSEATAEPGSTTPTAEVIKKAPEEQKIAPSPPSNNTLMSPTGQTLKKVPIKALPPGVKPLPLPLTGRTVGQPGELCEMQIGKKVVKVQKIVMTKAEVEAMAKKGLVEMKDGTMVLKQGIKLPTSELSLKSLPSLDAKKESPKTEKATKAQSNVTE